MISDHGGGGRFDYLVMRDPGVGGGLVYFVVGDHGGWRRSSPCGGGRAFEIRDHGVEI